MLTGRRLSSHSICTKPGFSSSGLTGSHWLSSSYSASILIVDGGASGGLDSNPECAGGIDKGAVLFVEGSPSGKAESGSGRLAWPEPLSADATLVAAVPATLSDVLPLREFRTLAPSFLGPWSSFWPTVMRTNWQ